MQTPIRLGIVGAGLIWQRAHRPALEKLRDRFRLSAFCVTSDARRAALAKEHPGVPVFTDYRQLVAASDIDAVVVLTPIALNGPVTLAALQAGKDVCVEKPLTTSSTEARTLLAAAAKNHKRICVLENAAYSRQWTVTRQILDDRKIGDLVLFDTVGHGFLDDAQHDCGGYGKTAWRKAADYPLGTLFDGGIHTIAVHSKLFGNPSSVFATGVKLRPGFGDYDEISMLFQYPGGRLKGFYSHSAYLSGNRNYFHIRGKNGVVRFEGNDAVVETLDQPVQKIPAPSAGSHDILWRAIAEHLLHGTPLPYSAEQAATDVHVLEAVAESIQTGQPVKI